MTRSRAASSDALDPRLRIQHVHTLRGPNIWSNSPILEAWVDVGSLHDVASNEVAGFNQRLTGWLPSMIEHRCSVGERGGFFQRLERGTYPAHILEHVTLELQSLAGTPVGYGKARAMCEHAIYRVVFRYNDEALGLAALDEARALVLAAYDDTPFDVDQAVARLRRAASPSSLDAASAALIAAAKDRDIPAFPLTADGLLQLGQGCHRTRLRACGLLTDGTSAVAEEMASDKALYRPLLKSIGTPVPYWSLVDTRDEALEEARDIGLPVWVKPLDRDDNPAHFKPMSTEVEVMSAFDAQSETSSRVVVEEAIAGTRYQFLVVSGRVIALQSVEPADCRHDFSGVHNSIFDHACAAARFIGLDAATVGIAARDLAQPLESQRGAVLFVSARPDLRLFLSGFADDTVASRLLDAVFPVGRAARIPLVAVAGDSRRALVATAATRLLASQGQLVGFARRATCEVDGRPLPGHWRGLFDATRALLMNPHVDSVVVEVGRADVLTEGLGFDRCRIAVVTGLDESAPLPLPDWGFEEPEVDLPRGERCVIEVVSAGGFAVLNADEPRVLAMAEHASAPVVLYSTSAATEAIDAHRQAGGRAIVADGPRIIAYDAEAPARTFPLAPDADPQIELPRAAIAWLLDLPSPVPTA